MRVEEIVTGKKDAFYCRRISWSLVDEYTAWIKKKKQWGIKIIQYEIYNAVQ